MGSRQLGVLIHGAGWVSTQHIQAFEANPNSRVVAISSRRLESARARASEAGLADVGLYDDLGTALSQPGVDIVAVCTPQHVHCDNVLAAAAAGKHIVIEKPIGNSMGEIRRMQEAVRAAGVKTVVSFVLRWNPYVQRAKQLIAEGALGKVFCVETDYLHNICSFWGGWPDGHRKDLGVSAHLIGGCHAIDAARWFAGHGQESAADPVEVFSLAGGWRMGADTEYLYSTHTWQDTDLRMEFEGLEMTLLRFPDGTVGKVSVNFDCVMPYTFPVRIFGDKGTLMDNRLWSHTIPEQAEWQTFETTLPDSGDVEHHPFQGQADHFVECILTDTDSHCNLDDAAKTHEIVFAARECYRTGRPVSLPLAQTGGAS